MISSRLKLVCGVLILAAIFNNRASAQEQPADYVNVFLGTSGDHGQLSPAASYPFSMLSIGPQTYPNLHAGYEYYAKEYLGFTHTRMEGVGCQGDGGNVLIRPFTDGKPYEHLTRISQDGAPGFFAAQFDNGINAAVAVSGKEGVHKYNFEGENNGLYIDLGYAFVGRFIEEQHENGDDYLKGYFKAGTTCSRGAYTIYYYIHFDHKVKWQEVEEHQLIASFAHNIKSTETKIAFSSVSTEYAEKSISKSSYAEIAKNAREAWNSELGRVEVNGDEERKALFYSLLYRTMQSPFKISENDGVYKNIDGSEGKSKEVMYNGWAIWDNYKTQLPLLSFLMPERYANFMWSIKQMYLHGKQDFSTPNEPSLTVRTEHALPVLLDAYNKGYKLSFKDALDSMKAENERLDYGTPDKALEAAYDDWALANIYDIEGNEGEAKKYFEKAKGYKEYWEKDFKDLSKRDIDWMPARNMYQGTIWQYRWLVPYDLKGLIDLCGGENEFVSQLDQFFDGDYYNHANEPDIQVPWMYNATSSSWKSELLIHQLALDTVNQFYFNNNSKGIDPYVGKIYKNEPKAFLRTMDDDAGAMSAWYVLASIGLSPALVGEPIYYMHVPFYESVTLKGGKSPLKVQVLNYSEDKIFIKQVKLNGKVLNRHWLTHKELMAGGLLEITAADVPLLNSNIEVYQSELNNY